MVEPRKADAVLHYLDGLARQAFLVDAELIDAMVDDAVAAGTPAAFVDNLRAFAAWRRALSRLSEWAEVQAAQDGPMGLPEEPMP